MRSDFGFNRYLEAQSNSAGKIKRSNQNHRKAETLRIETHRLRHLATESKVFNTALGNLADPNPPNLTQSTVG